MLQISDYSAAYDEILAKENPGDEKNMHLSKKFLETVIVKPDLRVVKNIIMPFAPLGNAIAKTCQQDDETGSPKGGWLVEGQSPGGTSNEIEGMNQRKAFFGARSNDNGQNGTQTKGKKDVFRITLSPIDPLYRRASKASMEDSSGFARSGSLGAETQDRFHKTDKISQFEVSSTRRDSARPGVFSQRSKGSQSSQANSKIFDFLGLDDDDVPLPTNVKNTTEVFVNNQMKPNFIKRIKTFEAFGFFERERKDPIFKRQLGVLRQNDCTGKIASTDLWTTRLHYGNMKAADMYDSRHKFLNFCFRSNAGIGTKLFKTLESNRNRNKEHQIEGKIMNWQQEWRQDQEDYNKVTNKIKRKYVKVILNKRGHDIDLTAAAPGSGGKTLNKNQHDSEQKDHQVRLEKILKDLHGLHVQTKKQKK